MRINAAARCRAHRRGEADAADRIVLLGDLFDAWIGDDDLGLAMHAEVAAGLHDLAGAGTEVSLLHGNRDFLLGEAFARASGARLLPDPAVVALGGIPTLLTHGDTLCTGDRDYLAFRTVVRDPAWQAAFLARPLSDRRAEAARLRAASEAGKRMKDMQIMDVAEAAVVDLLRAHGYPRLVHGHTHRPGMSSVGVDGRTCERWVLPDWDDRAEGLSIRSDGSADFWAL